MAKNCQKTVMLEIEHLIIISEDRLGSRRSEDIVSSSAPARSPFQNPANYIPNFIHLNHTPQNTLLVRDSGIEFSSVIEYEHQHG